MFNIYVGRKKYLERLMNLEHKKKASLVVVKGRRRIGKSRLIEEFAHNKIFLPFSGLAPLSDTTAQDQMNHFSQQMSVLFNISSPPYTSWMDAFNSLTHHLTSISSQKKIVLLFDEVSWMAHESPKFISQLKVWWDLNHPKFPNLIFVLCGSVSSWIENNILKSTAFFGRVSLEITLPPLSLPECCEFLKKNHVRGSAYDYYKILSILGGIPWYLEQLSPSKLIDEQIRDLCFNPDGLLVNEFDRIFHDLFGPQGTVYKKILISLGEGMKTQAEIREIMSYSHSGTLSKILHNLVVSGLITEHYQWSIKDKKIGKQSLYRLNDQYARFYIKYIEPNLPKIRRGDYDTPELIKLPGWNSIFGFQVESLMLQNREAILRSLNIQGQDVVCDNPYIQKNTTRKKGCQIDYLIQTQNHNLFICEFKFNRYEIGREIIESMKEKVKRLSTPMGMAKIPVLFYLGDVSESVYSSNYFYRIINIGDFLE